MITMRNFSVLVPQKDDALLGYTGENLSRRFEMDVDELGAWAYKLDICNEVGAANIIDLLPTKNILYADLERAALQVSGPVTAQIRAIDGERIKCSNTFRLFIGDSIEAVKYFESLPPSEFEQMEANLTVLRTEAVEAANRAESAADGIDEIRQLAEQAAKTAAAAVSGAESAANRAESAAADVEQSVSDAAGTVREQVKADADRAESAKIAAQTAQTAAEKAAQEAESAAGGGVTSFNGRSGAVTPEKGDYDADDITFSDGQTFQQKYDSGELRGQDGHIGAAGQDGVDGYTPVKGADYFTAADRAEMVADVVDEMGDVAPASHTHTASEVGARASNWVPTQTQVTVSAATDYTTVRVRGIALAKDSAVSVPNGCLCGVYTVS